MRVIAGSAKGRRLIGPKAAGTRPTSDKAREGIFATVDSLLEERRESEQTSPWERLRVIDLYAGTGALGIEALSRGAAAAVFVEADRSTCRTIERNLALTGLAPRGRVICTTVQRFLAGAREDSYDLVLMDPPYACSELEDVIQWLASKGPLRPGSLLVVEHAHRRPVGPDVGALSRVREKSYGDTDISIYMLADRPAD